jgi:hypothetical protein
VTLAGHIDQRWTSGACPAESLTFTETVTLTQHDPRLDQAPSVNGTSVELGDFFGEFRVRWDPPDSGSDLWPFAVEWQAEPPDAGWEAVDLFDTGGGYSGTTAALTETELDVFRFRVRSTNGYTLGPFSPEVSIITGFRAPYSLSINQQGRDVHLTWTDPRPQATGLRIERLLSLGDGGWASTPVGDVTLPAMEYVDALPGEGDWWAYRARWFNASVDGYPFVSSTVRSPLLAPDGLVVTTDQTGVDLHWTNHSVLASGINLTRTPYASSTQSATFQLPPDVTSYLDQVPAPGAYLYTLQAVSSTAVVSAPISAWAVTPMDPGLGLDSSILELPVFYTPPVRDSLGHWYVLANGALIKTGDPAWTPHPYSMVWQLPQPVLVDSGDVPHLLGLQPSASGTTTDLVHEWFDGAWRSEVVASLQLPAPDLAPLRWQLDAANRPVVVTSSTSDSSGLQVVAWSGSGYAVEAPAATLTPVDNLRGMAIVLSPGGHIEIAVSGDQGLLLLERSTGWSATTLASSISRPDLELLAGTNTLDLIAGNDAAALGTETFVLHRQGAVWSAPQEFPPLCCYVPSHMAAETLAGTRPVVSLQDATNGVLLAHGDQGWATEPLGWFAAVRSLGYDPAGKLYGMVAVDDHPDTTTVVEFHER